jgi:predicted nuclease of restriction endonuclease-like (RecB) superfamily
MENRKNNLKPLIENISDLLEKSRTKIYTKINTILVQTYWQIGKYIIEFEQGGDKRAKYGTYLFEQLEKELKQYGKGFTADNLRRMRQFYEVFPIWDTVCHKLNWSCYRLILKIEDKTEREFYINEVIQNNLSVRQLQRQINSHLYHRLQSSKSKDTQKLTENRFEIQKPEDIIKEPYVLEFLNLKENVDLLEKDLEKLLISNLEKFLLELGKGFAFIKRQYRIDIDDDNYYIDLVFYNHILKCFFVIELKTQKLTHKDIGQMDFYLRYFEKEVKGEDDNPTVGLILCPEKNDKMTQYTILNDKNNLFASKYKLYLPNIDDLKNELIKQKEIIEIEKEINEKGGKS